jgi:hypothetical protein
VAAFRTAGIILSLLTQAPLEAFLPYPEIAFRLENDSHRDSQYAGIGWGLPGDRGVTLGRDKRRETGADPYCGAALRMEMSHQAIPLTGALVGDARPDSLRVPFETINSIGI